MGYYVIINFQRNEEEANKTLALIRENGSDGELMKFDVGSKSEIESILGAWVETNKDKVIEVLVNNAGIRKDNLMMMMPDTDWDTVLRTNLDSFFYVTKAILQNMVAKRYGRIVNVVSLSGIKGLPGQVNYSASKAGVIGASKALAQEVGRRGVTVNCVAPGFIKTDMTEAIDPTLYRNIIPMQRFGEAEEVAAIVGFLASKEASYITGEVIHVNGGLHT
ncbi:MAG: fabG [Bacteroidetes bacterium]|nr:fabG [Bacteroidota bacterium]